MIIWNPAFGQMQERRVLFRQGLARNVTNCSVCETFWRGTELEPKIIKNEFSSEMTGVAGDVDRFIH